MSTSASAPFYGLNGILAVRHAFGEERARRSGALGVERADHRSLFYQAADDQNAWGVAHVVGLGLKRQPEHRNSFYRERSRHRLR